MNHICHASGCTKKVHPKFLMCKVHWGMVPNNLQREIWRTYRRGQEIDKKPSTEYLIAQRAAIQAVAVKEGKIDESI